MALSSRIAGNGQRTFTRMMATMLSPGPAAPMTCGRANPTVQRSLTGVSFVGAAHPIRVRHFHSSLGNSMAIVPFTLPDIGEGIAEVEIIRWVVKEGDKVAQFDKVVEVQSDKANVEITSRFDGVIKKLHYKAGEMAKTGKPLMDIEVSGEVEEGSEASTGTPATRPTATGSTSCANPSINSATAAVDDGEAISVPDSIRALATPAVRRVAREHSVDITRIRGSGKDGRVTKDDVQRYIDNGGHAAATSGVTAAAPVAPSPSPAPTTVSTSTSATATTTGASASVPWVSTGYGTAPDVKVPVRGLSRAMAKSMTTAWSVPHFGYSDEVCMDQLMAVRDELKGLAKEKGLKFSYLPLILKATSLALRSYPQLNAHVAADVSEVTHKGSHNIGVAMDTPNGLIVPNVKHVEQRSLLEIAAELARLQVLASSGKLGAADLSEGTFTLSNIGTIGGTYASPVLFMPQVAIGAIGKISKLPRYASTLPGGSKPAKGGEDTIVPAHIMTISWAADHRVVDGATMARFSNLWKRYLEAPATMMAEMR